MEPLLLGAISNPDLATFLLSFTAWSSVREPSQVFVLLQVLISSSLVVFIVALELILLTAVLVFVQKIYQTFDQLAKRRHVFKVETIGDCCEYIAYCTFP